MSKLDKFILFTVKFIVGSILLGIVSLWFFTVGMMILGINFESKVNALQVIFMLGFTGIPFYFAVLLAKHAEWFKGDRDD
jgi:hypothetical protein